MGRTAMQKRGRGLFTVWEVAWQISMRHRRRGDRQARGRIVQNERGKICSVAEQRGVNESKKRAGTCCVQYMEGGRSRQ